MKRLAALLLFLAGCDPYIPPPSDGRLCCERWNNYCCEVTEEWMAPGDVCYCDGQPGVVVVETDE